MATGEPSHSESARPLSPHLQIYTPQINMVMSIIHRITGVALYFGTLLLACWLIAAASGPEWFDFVNALFGSLLGRLVMLAYTWALLHHMFGGIRHLVWDTGRGFQLSQVDFLCWFTLIASLACTVLIWVMAGSLEGVS
ncbi:MAG: succinate dehydrogenase, cytochrome b556 subunit [Pseudomonadota bacterium]